MITHEDQLKLFNFISEKLEADVICYAFGGTAMMFYGYKEDTKDIDVLFEKDEDRNKFIRAIEKMGFSQSSPVKIYVPEKLKNPNRPLMYSRSDYRFDLFVTKIFKTIISPSMKEDLFGVHEFLGKNKLIIKVLRTEHIVMLKAVTERDKDFEDILTIVKKDKNFDWQYLIDEVVWQYDNGDEWIVLDVEKMLTELKNYVFIEEKFIKQLYEAVEKKNKEKSNENSSRKTKRKKSKKS